jgi:NADH-quinone oxidoreductase subunit E
MRKKQFKLSADRAKRAERILSLYPVPQAAVLPLLWLVHEQEGWIVPEACAMIADMAEVTEASVYEAVSFYSLLSAQPLALHNIRICTGLCCRLKGADRILQHLCSKLGIKPGEYTGDKRFHLSTVECLGFCDGAPMMMIGEECYENLDEAEVDEILNKLKS